MGFNFGTKKVVVKEVAAHDSVMALVMQPVEGTGTNRKFVFSKLAAETLEFHKNATPGEGVMETIVNTSISLGNTTDALGNPINFSLFVNNGIDGADTIAVGKTTNGFSNKDFYNKLVRLYNLDETKENVLLLNRTTTAQDVEAEYGIEIYDITIASAVEDRVEEVEDILLHSSSEALDENLGMENVLDHNENVEVTLS